jgi:lysophospholipase L1-like esterase
MNTFLQLGDSYTIGEGVDDAGRWGNQMAHALRKEGVAITDPHIVATTGWTSGELIARLDALEPLGNAWGLVSLLIGVNNQYRGLPVETYANEFDILLDRAVAYAQGDADRVLVMSIPDWGVTPFARSQGRVEAEVARDIDAYNAIARERCESLAVRFVDITPVSRRYGGEVDMLVADALHPSAAMYGLWAAQALPVVRQMPWVDSVA